MSGPMRARLRMLALIPTDAPAPGTVAAADLRTSMCDARVALSLTLEQPCDLAGFSTGLSPQGDAKPGDNSELVLFEVAA